MWDRQNAPIVRSAFNTPAPNGQTPAQCALNMGTVPGSRVAFSVNPTNNDTLAIGGTTFKFVTSLGAAAAQVQVKILGTAALTLASLINAINGVTTDTNWVEATTPFAVTVVADNPTATQLRIRWATKRGGLPLAAVASTTALTASITGGASAWTTTNLNTSGKAAADVQQAYGAITVTAAMITAGFIDVELEFQPTLYDIFVVNASGTQKVITEVVTIPNNQKSLHITTGTGGTPLAATDVLNYWAGA